MPFKIIHKKVGIADSLGATTKMYEVDEVIDDNEDWKKDLGQRFVESGNAMYVDAEVVVPMTKGYDDLPSDVEPKEEKLKKKKKKTFFGKK
jgi:hypothetical protein